MTGIDDERYLTCICNRRELTVKDKRRRRRRKTPATRWFN